jgi:hypothetical protein
MYTESEEKKHWQHAWHIVLASSNEDGDSCNAECVRFCDARAFSKSFLPSDSEKHTLSFKVISKDSEEYNLCKRNHRNPGEMLSLNDKKMAGINGFFTLPSPNPCKSDKEKIDITAIAQSDTPKSAPSPFEEKKRYFKFR